VERHLFASFPRTPKGKLNWQARDTQGGKFLQGIHGTNVLDHPSICFHEKKTELAPIYCESAKVPTHP